MQDSSVNGERRLFQFSIEFPSHDSFSVFERMHAGPKYNGFSENGGKSNSTSVNFNRIKLILCTAKFAL